MNNFLVTGNGSGNGAGSGRGNGNGNGNGNGVGSGYGDSYGNGDGNGNGNGYSYGNGDGNGNGNGYSNGNGNGYSSGSNGVGVGVGDGYNLIHSGGLIDIREFTSFQLLKPLIHRGYDHAPLQSHAGELQHQALEPARARPQGQQGSPEAAQRGG